MLIARNPHRRHARRPPVTIPGNRGAIDGAVARSRKLVNRRSLMSAGAVLLPVPGLDFAADIALLMQLIKEVNDEFGLAPEMIERLSPNRRVLVYRALVAVGGAMVGKVITRGLVVRSLATVGVRLTAKQATKYVPIAGQALSAGISYSAMRYVGLQHIADCVRVTESLIELDAVPQASRI